MSDPQDIHVVPQVKADHNEKPTIFFYDRYPGGIGLSEKIFTEMDSVLLDAKKMIERCYCQHGCPSCIGAEAISDTAKKDTLKIIDSLLKNEKGLRV
jgi:DEAD/DEAH box helicase domain-containing protein